MKATRTAPHPVLSQYYASQDDRQRFVAALFDGAARHYDRLCGVMSLGCGQSYRRAVLRRAGLRPGMSLLDVATGTGLVARSAMSVLGETRAVVGLDPSHGMLREARKTLSVSLVQGRVEDLSFAANRFDLVSMGYALRHVADLGVAFAECRRVLKPEGRLVVLEVSRPRSVVGEWVLRVFLQKVVPLIMRVTTGYAQAGLITNYYWDTIAQCVPPAEILEILRASGFVDVERRVSRGFLSEYVGIKPAG